LTAAAQAYAARFRRVLDYIDAHLQVDLDVDHLSGVAAFSKFHFHRQFTELFGIGVCKYVQLNRLKRASFQLAFREDMKIIDVALASGYDESESFARAFRQNVGQSPSQFRKDPQWEPWHEIFTAVSEIRESHMKHNYSSADVRIVDFRETRVATLEHRGDPRLVGDSIRKFIEWRKRIGLSPRISATFNIAYDDPTTTNPADFRFDLCAATERDIQPNDAGVVAKIIPGGRCATMRNVGSDDNLRAPAHYLYSQWLPQSGEVLRDFPLFFQRVRFFPDVAEPEAVTDVFLPLK
jgi:AraC family transcriptional regulator